ncbi:MAG: relaxase/mobilization nuclease domain-containing protein [Alphaproteobacteria bacterium]|nr:relaxase/mobilization nuclease domain-containing protein [Alphaproteobacteria bacterium]
MIIRMLSAGKSFKGAAAYLTHDADHAETSERVAWTHTLNLANDHVPSAISEMYLTAENAEILKQEAGIRAGGRATENPVKHFSLNWSPEENPTRDHMIEATEDFLRHMGWDEHQAVLVAHDEKTYDHVHVLLNAVHPENGTKIDEGFEYRRAQKWALEYEREHGMFCDQRLENAENREESMPRPAWVAFQESQKEFEREENARLGPDEKTRGENRADGVDNSDGPEDPYAREWRILKKIERGEREDFVAESRAQFKDLRGAIYREVREEFRPLWANYYAAVENWGDSQTFAELKENLIAGQSELLSARRDEAMDALRKERADLYKEVLSDQRSDRATLHDRQGAGLDSADFLTSVEERRYARANERTDEHRENGKEDERSTGDRSTAGGFGRDPEPDNGGTRSGGDIGLGGAIGSALFFASILGSIGDALTGTETRKPQVPAREPEESRSSTRKADDDAAWIASRKREQEEAAYRDRQQERYWE